MTTQTSEKRRKSTIKKQDLLDILEQLPGRIEMLNDTDRAFVNLILAGQKFRTIARTAGVHEATVARRLKKIAMRITDNQFINSLSHKHLTPKKMQILRDYFVDGWPMLRIAVRNNISYYKVRQIIHKQRSTAKNYTESANN
jgi:hypothetical protein